MADEGVWQGGQPNKQSRSWRRRSSALRGLRSAWQCPQAYLGACWGSELDSLKPARVPTAAVAPVLEPAMAAALTALSTALVALVAAEVRPAPTAPHGALSKRMES